MLRSHLLLTGLAAVLLLLSGSCSPVGVPEELAAPKVLEMREMASSSVVTMTCVLSPTGGVKGCVFILSKGGSEILRRDGAKGDDGAYSCTVNGLEQDTEYSWAVSISNGRDTLESASTAFRTLPEPDPGPGDDPDPVPGDDPVVIPEVDPDPTLWEYIVSKFDSDADGTMSDEELLGIQELQIADLPVDSLAGLEALVNLRTLGMGGHYLKRIDLSANKNLELLYAGREVLLEEFYLDNPKLGYLYLIECKVLKSLDFSRCPEITMLELYNNQSLESIDLSKNRKLEVFRLTGSKVKELDLSNCRRIQQLSSEDNPLLEKVILHKEAAPEVLSVESHTKIIYQ